MGVALLAAASIAGLRATEPTGVPCSYEDGAAEVVEEQLQVRGGLAPFLAQDGLRPGTVLAAVLLVLPFAALALQALRVGSLALEQQAARLCLAGATPSDLRRVRVRRSALSFGAGGLLAGLLHLLLWPALGPAVSPGWRLLRGCCRSLRRGCCRSGWRSRRPWPSSAPGSRSASARVRTRCRGSPPRQRPQRAPWPR
jgi:hypothetical protein